MTFAPTSGAKVIPRKSEKYVICHALYNMSICISDPGQMSNIKMLQVQFKWKSKLRTQNSDSYSPLVAEKGSAASRSRERMKKNNPSKYEQYKAKDAARKRQAYAAECEKLKTSGSLLEQRRKKWAEAKRNQRREKKHREENQLREEPVTKRLKDMSGEEKRKYMKLKKQESRQRMSKQKRVGMKKKETAARAEVRRKVQQKKNEDQPGTSSEQASRTTMYRRKVKAKRHMPQSPGQYASVVEHLVENASPRKKIEIERRGIKRKIESSLEESVRGTIKQLKTNMTEKKRQQYNVIAYACQRMKKYGTKKRIASSLGIGGKMTRKAKEIAGRKKRKDVISDEVVYLVEDFWKSEGISRVVPLKKQVRKGQPAYVLECNYTQAYQRFRKAHPNVKIGFVKFLELKPKCVKKMKALERIVCCCKTCENAKLKLKAMNKQATKKQKPDLHIPTIHELSKKTLCEYDEPGFPRRACTDRKCPEQCGTGKLDEWYAPLTEDEDDDLEYDEWKTVVEERWAKKKGQSRPVKITRRVFRLITTTTTTSNLISLLKSDTEKLAGHLFRAAWQQRQFRLSKENMPPRTAVTVIDFAENYACSMQDEVQSYHWAQQQATVHPVMAFLNATDDTSPGPTHTEAIFCISDDPKHDADAVETFMQKTTEHLKQKFQIQNEVRFSDCCAAQYRGRTSFADISLTHRDHGVQMTRHFFESSHGKSAADGLAAIVKNAATSAVTRRQAKIRSAEEFHSFCRAELEQVAGNSVFPSRADMYKDAGRKFIYVPSTDINRERPERDVAPVKGTMTVHAVLPTAPYEIRIRNLSCFCSFCRNGQGLKCKNASLVGNWKDVSLKPVATKPGAAQAAREIVEEDSGEEVSDEEEADAWSCSESLGDGASASVTSAGDFRFTAGDFAGVKIKQGKRPCYIYMVELVEVDRLQEEALLKYLVRCSDNVYRWPDPEAQEYSTEPLSSLLGPLHHPTVFNARGQMKFPPAQLANIIDVAKMSHKSVYFK